MNGPILIFAHPRTGSTLLRYLLDTHPAICSSAELRLGAVCELLHRAIDLTIGQAGGATGEARRARGFAETRRVIDDLMREYCAIKGKQRWCEKTPSNLDHLDILRSVFPDGRYVCLHRHCLDVVHSCLEMHGTNPAYMQPYADKTGGNGVAAWILRWCDRTEQLLAFEAENPASSFRVTYEALIADTDATLRALLAFVGVDWVPGLPEKVFSMQHEVGLGDPKIVGSVAVETDRVGKGRQLDISHTPAPLRDRMQRLLAAVGYQDAPAAEVRETGDRTSASRLRLTNVEELFTTYFPHQFARHRARLRQAKGALTVVVTGPGGGTWTLAAEPGGRDLQSLEQEFAEIDARAISGDLEALALIETLAKTCIVPGERDARLTLTMAAETLLAIANRETTLAEALFADKLSIRGSIEPEDLELGEQVVWALFGEDFRPEY